MVASLGGMQTDRGGARLMLTLVGGLALVLVFVATFLMARARASESGTPPLEIDRARREVRLRARVQPNAMTRPFGVKGHHAIVWKGGRAAAWALFRAEASDRDVRAALASLGAVAGENLTAETWNERKNPASPEPDKRVEGTPIEVWISWQGHEPQPLGNFLLEKGRSAPQLDFRYGGNQRYQPQFKSGCIVCLYSCPGGAIGNRAHPIRDWIRDGVVYASIPKRLPKAGSDVTIILKVKK